MLYPGRVTDTGAAFGINFTKWAPNTKITLTNVPWNNDYRDVWRPDTQADLDNYIDEVAESVDITQTSLAKFGQKVRVGIPFNTAAKYNYLRASNPLSPIDGDVQRNYYYFVTGYEYVNPSTTVLNLQLDVWQTYIYDVTFGQCYIERGHLGIANSRQFEHYGRDYLTIPEGIDVGSEYRTVHVEFESLQADDGLNVLIVSSYDFTVDPGTATDPTLQTATGSLFNNLPTGANFYVFATIQDFEAFMSHYAQYSWATEAIMSITLLPLKRYFPSFSFADNISPVAGVTFYAGPPMMTEAYTNTVLLNWRNAEFIGNILGEDFAVLKKFLTYPYMFIELTTFTGSPVVIKPEMWQDDGANIVEIGAFMPPGQRIAIMPRRYNADDETEATSSLWQSDDGGEFLDFAAFLDNFPTLPIVNNGFINYLASNHAGIPYSFRSAGWEQQRALAGAAANAAIAGSQMTNTRSQANIANAATAEQASLNTQMAVSHGILNAGNDVANGIGRGDGIGVAGGAFDAATSAMRTVTDIGGIQRSSDIQQTARTGSAGADIQTAGQIRDTNLGYANMAANGDYHNTIAGINAKIQDAMMTQPSTSGQFNGDSFNIANNLLGYSLRWKMLNLNYLRRVGMYWLRYGYAIQQWGTMPDNFHCMTKFTYWKLQETYITRAFMPEGMKQIIRAIFEKGVTVWQNATDIGTTQMTDNQPLPGISY